MSRELGDWLSNYLRYTEWSEPPKSYHTWVGLSLISGALQRRCVLRWGFETIYPNLYVVLVGPSGRARKGIALGIGKDLLSDVSGVTIVPEAGSREALIRTMKDANYNFQDKDGKIRYHSSVVAFSEELSVFLGQNDIKFLSSLTDWYDSKDRWAYDTISRGKDFINGVCVTLIGGTAPDWLQSMLPQEAVGGGFTSRIIFVVEERKGKTVPEHKVTQEEMELRTKLLTDLNRINTLTGEFSFDPGGRAAYVNWYTKYDKALDQGNAPVSDPKFSGYCERRATHLRKLAMVLSASRSDRLLITKDDIKRADEMLSAVEVKMAKTFGGVGRNAIGAQTHEVLETIKHLGMITRSNMVRRFYRDLSMDEMGQIEHLLEQSKLVKIALLKSGDKTYTWLGDDDDD